MEKHLHLGPIQLNIVTPDGIEDFMPNNFRLFEVVGEKAESNQYHYSLSVGKVSCTEEKPIFQSPDLEVYQEEDLETRLLTMGSRENAYALYKEISEHEAEVTVSPEVLDELKIVDPMYASLFALERRMLDHNGLIFHTAYTRRSEGDAILFSGPSGIGKSTQGGLWENYRGAEVMNGDRALLRKIDGVWHAEGWPVCGSSGICKNVTTPIGQIVMLSQAKENRVRRVRPMEAFAMVYAQVTVNRWNREGTRKAMDLIEDLITSVPVYHMECDISEGAVECLENAIRR